MKTSLTLFCVILALFSPITGWAFDHSHAQFEGVLKKYVDDKGMVNYAALKKNRADLDAYLKTTGAISESEFKAWTHDQRLAFLINVYNAETLQLIIDHYPVKSIKKIGGFFFGQPWDVECVTLFGKKTTLNHIEHDILRPKYKEPRVHFVIVCAAMGCPPLSNQVFVAESLDQQLDTRGQVFLAQKNKNKLDGSTLYLSPIFSWFAEDFTKNGSLQDFVAKFFPTDIKGKKLKIKYTSYDWSLNKQ
ncbi:MAG: DUF547 domain-containing protein [Verrucomicrobiales bacterium]|nr:DUF547 domain-containing protein [Verrucomicrobiales bacterium]